MVFTNMKLTSCLLVGLDPHFEAIVRDAARLSFPGFVVTTFNFLNDALDRRPSAGRELLILASPDEESKKKAFEATDASGLSRWAIVILETAVTDKGLEVVSFEECNETLLARAFRSALAQHWLIRENERFRGDLQTLAYRISHDLRTPLGGISCTGEALKEIVAEHEPSSAGLTEALFSSVDELGDLIQRVSQVTIASANVLVPKKVLAMGDIVCAVLQQHERKLLEQNAAVTQPDLWPDVEGVFDWLELVWGNLIANAVEHGKAAARIELGWRQAANEFRFWVADAGSGIPAEDVDALFQPFHLLHQPDARKGLGLSIVHRLVELQGGCCGYEPRSGGGSRFWFTLPSSEGASVPPLKNSQQASSHD